MAIISLRQLLDYAATHGCVAAFNVNNLEQVRAIMQAAQKTNSPVILQASFGARKYTGPQFLQGMVQAAVTEWPNIPVCLHQAMVVARCLHSLHTRWVFIGDDGWLWRGYENPTTYDYNVRVTKLVVDYAHACGVSVEGELGCLGLGNRFW